jgi:hypothetical protein
MPPSLDSHRVSVKAFDPFTHDELNRLRRDRIAAILAAYVSYAGETPAVQIQIPMPSSYVMKIDNLSQGACV